MCVGHKTHFFQRTSPGISQGPSSTSVVRRVIYTDTPVIKRLHAAHVMADGYLIEFCHSHTGTFANLQLGIGHVDSSIRLSKSVVLVTTGGHNFDETQVPWDYNL